MKVVKRVALVLRQGRERAYIAELVELERTEPERYLVNYRYGWAGSDLTEGTRTDDPVDLPTAERLFESLIVTRKNQGYRDAESEAPWKAETPKGPSSAAGEVQDPRAARLLYLLERVDAMSDEAASRLVWRIGQVRVTDAVPMLLELRHHAGPVTARGLVYAILRCGKDRPDDILPALRTIHADDPVIAEQARIASTLLGDPGEASAALRAGLPDEVASAMDEPHQIAVQRISGYLAAAADEARRHRLPDGADYGAEQHRALVDLFLLSHVAPQTRPIVLDVLRSVPLAGFVFRGVRRVFKAAEALDDAETFACLAQRFDDVKGTYNSKGWAHARSDKTSDRSRLAWSHASRNYFRRRIWRQLRRLGTLADAAYVRMAAACLIEAPVDNAQGRLVNPIGYTFHQIMHGRTKRMWQGNKNLNWLLKPGASRDAETREEPFAELWDAAPDAALGLLANARSETVQAFGARILADNPDFCAQIPAVQVAALLARPSNGVYQFALGVVRARLSAAPEQANLLVPALFACGRPEALELAKAVLSVKPDLATRDSGFAAGLLLSVTKTSFDWLDGFWRQYAAGADLPDLMNKIMETAAARDWAPENLSAEKQNVRLCCTLLSTHFNTAVQGMNGEFLTILSRSDAVPLNLLAILLAAERPDGLQRFDPESLGKHPDPDIQSAGAQLLARAAPDALMQHEDLVLAFLQSGVAASRDAAVTAAERIAALDTGAADRLAVGLAPILYRREQEPGTRDSAVAAAMTAPILASFVRQGPDQIWKLLRAKAEPARRVGSQALQHMPPAAFSLRKVARIGTNDQLSARQWAVAGLEARLAEVAERPEQIFALLDGEWQDSREAAYDLIRTRLDPGTWQPETVVALCDCITKPAQAFGREMLTRAFSQDNAELFLRRLSEHPSASFRLTIARLIREYAADDPKRLRDVEPALRTILSRVFSSRAAKNQSFAYIGEEIARANPASLPILGDLLERLSATCSTGDRGRILELIVRLKAADPGLVPSVTIVVPEERRVRAV